LIPAHCSFTKNPPPVGSPSLAPVGARTNRGSCTPIPPEDRGFGFTAPDGGEAHIFVHASHIANADALKKDQRVSFEIVTDDRRNKPRADRVRVI
jgi:cold shock CspA family protein